MSHDIDARIFVGGLDHECDETVLEKAFSMFGDITQILVMRDRETNKPRGFGFISFKDPTSAEDAITRMHGVEVMGRCVTVRKAEKQSDMNERPRRGGFRGGRGGGDRHGGRFDSRYESRGRGYSDGRRTSSDGYQGSYGSSRGGSSSYGYSKRGDGGYSDSRRGGLDSSRVGYRDMYDESRGGGYGESRRGSGYHDGGSRHGGYSDEYEDTREYAEERYSSNRKNYSDDRYGYSRKEESSRNYGEPYSGSSRYESASHGRSRSPGGRYLYREDSPVPVKIRRTVDSSFGREYSPVSSRRHAVREYSPLTSGGKSSMSRGYSMQESRGYDSSYRDYSPSRNRGHEPSPDNFTSSRSRGRAGSPSRGRPTYAGSRSGPSSKAGIASRKSDYISNRPQSMTGRGGRYQSDMSSKDHHSRAPTGRPSANGQDFGSGSRSSYAGHGDASSRPRYAQGRHDASPPNLRGQKRQSQRNDSPDRRARRY